MPLDHKDTRRAIELLRNYRDKLTSPSDNGLRLAIDRIIVVFESNLFKALLDIQRFYEMIVLWEEKSSQDKLTDAVQFVSDLTHEDYPHSVTYSSLPYRPINDKGSGDRKMNHCANGFSNTLPHSGVMSKYVSPYEHVEPNGISSSSRLTNVTPDVNHVELVTLHRSASCNTGFGFSIAGGKDTSHSNVQESPYVYVTRITPKSIAATDGRLRVNDVILKVNGISVEEVTHIFAVDQLKKTGDVLSLLVQHTPSSVRSSQIFPTPSWPLTASPLHSRPPSLGSIQVPVTNFSPSKTLPDRPASQLITTTFGLSRKSSIESSPAKRHIPLTLPKLIPTSAALESDDPESGASYSDSSSSGSCCDSEEHAVITRPSYSSHSLSKVTISSHKPYERSIIKGTILPSGQMIHVELDKTPHGLGFSIVGGVHDEHVKGDTGIFITKVMKGGPAELEGHMRAGDRLIAVNEVSLVNVSHQDAVNSLRNSGPRVHLTLLQPAEEMRTFYELGDTTPLSESGKKEHDRHRKTSNDFLDRRLRPYEYGSSLEKPNTNLEDARVTCLNRGVHGLGFNIVGGEMGEGIFISYVHPGGPAAISANLRVGDQIISVNDADLTGVSHEEGASILKRAGDFVELVTIYRPEEYSAIESKIYDPTPLNSHEKDIHGHSNGPCKSLPSSNLVSAQMNSLPSTHRSQSTLPHVLSNSAGQSLSSSVMPVLPPTMPNSHFNLSQQNFSSSANPSTRKTISPRLPVSIVKRMPQSKDETTLLEKRFMRPTKSQNNLLDNTVSCVRTLPKEFHVRALFDYEASKDSGLPSRGLSFRIGDILHVVDAVDEEWWRARLEYIHGSESATSLIPSHWRVERRERARLKRVNFNRNGILGNAISSPNLRVSTFTQGDSNSSPRDSRRMSNNGGTMGDRQPSFRRVARSSTVRQSSLGRKIIGRNNSSASSALVGAIAGSRSREGLNEALLEPIATYERVERRTASFERPVILLGALKENLQDALVTDYPDRFRTCIPHTTRSPREGEIDGHDYYFVSTREEMEREIQQRHFVEAGQYNGNLYGTSLKAILDVANNGSHCILDVSAPAISRLWDAGVHPIALFVYPQTMEQLKELLSSVGKWQEDHDDSALTQSMENYHKLRNENASSFSGILTEERNFPSLYARVKQVIQDQSDNGIWIPSRDQLW